LSGFEDRLARALRTVAEGLDGPEPPERAQPDLFEAGSGPVDAPRSTAFSSPRKAPSKEYAEPALRGVDESIWENFELALRAEPSPDREAAAYAIRAIREGPVAATDRSHEEVRAVLQAAYKVRRELHRLLGLLRFAPDAAGVYTAFCEPDHYILDLLVPAFRRRFGAGPFCIVDLRRGVSISVQGGQLIRRALDESGDSPPSRTAESGDPSVELWRTYYRATENPSRSNPRLRLQFMPRRYWKYLPEVGGGPSGG
jgi:probable DNA metabolism protein